MAEPFSRPVLTANDLASIVEGLELYGQQWRQSATVAARNAVTTEDQAEAGALLSLAVEVDDLQQRLRTLMDNVVNELIDRQIAESLGREEDDSLPTVGEDEVGTIPLPIHTGEE